MEGFEKPAPDKVLKKAAEKYVDDILREYVDEASVSKIKEKGGPKITIAIANTVANYGEYLKNEKISNLSDADARDILEGGDFYKEIQAIADEFNDVVL